MFNLSICVQKDPQQLTCCGKLICYSCLSAWEKTSPRCPNCRQTMKYFTGVKCKLIYIRNAPFSLCLYFSSCACVCLLPIFSPSSIKFFTYNNYFNLADRVIKQLQVKCEDHTCTSWPIRRELLASLKVGY